MGCVLRVAGEGLDVDAFFQQSSLQPLAVYRVGDKGFPKSRGPCIQPGFNVSVSDAEMSELDIQIKDAIAFLNSNNIELLRLRDFPGAENLVLDFGVEQIDVPIQGNRFPAELLRLAGAMNIDLQVSRYWECLDSPMGHSSIR
jgi:hypothetical protein